MNRWYIFFLFLIPFWMNAMNGGVLDDVVDREEEVERLLEVFYAGDTLPENQRVWLRNYLIALPQGEYLGIVAQIQGRSASPSPEETSKDDLVKVLFAIVARLDKQNEYMQQQVGEFKRFNDGQDEDGEREQEAHELAKKDSAFARYSWRVGTVLGVLGTLLSTAIAIWQGDAAAQC